MGKKDNVTLVSGFWDVVGPYPQETMKQWIQSAIRINQRMYFFCDEATKPFIQKCRGDLDTIILIHNITDFYSHGIYNEAWIKGVMEIPTHKYGLTLVERINLIKMAKDLDGDDATPYYVWYDPTFSPYRDQIPPSVRLNFHTTPAFLDTRIGVSGYYPEHDDKVVDGSAYVLHKDMIDDIFVYYYNLLKTNYLLVAKRELRSDETIMSVIYKSMPALFYEMATGPGGNLLNIYNM